MRGFSKSEYATRLARAQSLLAAKNLDGLLLTTEPELRYFTGFLTRFWESPTRPWFLLIPQTGPTTAIIPSIGVPLMQKMTAGEIRSWSSPDLQDDGITLLATSIAEIFGQKAKIGIPSGHETHLRMPLDSYFRLKDAISPSILTSDEGIMRTLRLVKSPAEIEKIKTACQIAGRAFDRVGEIAQIGTPFSQVCRDFQRLCLEEGADWVPYLAGGTGKMGYDDVISPATDEPLQESHVFMLDTGLVYDGYFCDFDRNFVLPPAPNSATTDSATLNSAYSRLLDATEAGKQAAIIGNTAADIYNAMNKILNQPPTASLPVPNLAATPLTPTADHIAPARPENNTDALLGDPATSLGGPTASPPAPNLAASALASNHSAAINQPPTTTAASPPARNPDAADHIAPAHPAPAPDHIAPAASSSLPAPNLAASALASAHQENTSAATPSTLAPATPPSISPGRLGHGLGMQLTEAPSFIPTDFTFLSSGMVITLEPSIFMPDGSVLVHEDVFVLLDSGLVQLSPLAPSCLSPLPPPPPRAQRAPRPHSRAAQRTPRAQPRARSHPPPSSIRSSSP